MEDIFVIFIHYVYNLSNVYTVVELILLKRRELFNQYIE